MISVNGRTFHLQGKNYCYVCYVSPEGYLLNFHYGRRIPPADYGAEDGLLSEPYPQLDGGYPQYVTCPADCLHKIPASMSYDEGGILEACLCPFGLIYRNGIRPDETVLIQGAGAAGLSFLQSVKRYSPRKVLVAVRKESTEKLAYRFGADVVTNTAREDLHRRVAEETGGLGVTLSIDAAGAKTTVEDAVCLPDSVSVVRFSAFHDSGGRLDSVPGAALIRVKFPLFPLALFLERYHFHRYVHLLSSKSSSVQISS